MLEVKCEYSGLLKHPANLRTKTERRKEIVDLESAISSENEHLTEKDYPLNHYFAPGVYAREIFLPKGHTVVGKIHKHSHLNIISYGHVIVATEDGNKELIGPCTFTSESGTKRAVHIIQDTMWTTIHLTKSTNLEKIEDEIIADSFESLELYRKQIEG